MIVHGVTKIPMCVLLEQINLWFTKSTIQKVAIFTEPIQLTTLMCHTIVHVLAAVGAVSINNGLKLIRESQ